MLRQRIYGVLSRNLLELMSTKSWIHGLSRKTQFLSSALDSDAQWIVPVTLCVSSYENQKKVLLEAKNGQLDIRDREEVQENWWIKINVHQAGFYRMKYDAKLEAQLWKAIRNNCLSASDEFGILDDAFALCEACLTPFSCLLHLMDTYNKKDLEYIVLTRLISVCSSASRIIRDAIPDLESGLKKFFITLLQPHAEKLGWDAVAGESQLDELKREQVLTALTNLDHPQTKEEAINRFQAFLEDRNTSLLPVNTRKAAYVAVMRNTHSSDKTGLQWLQNLYREVDSVHEKTRILRCIASSPDPAIISEVLDFVLTDEFPHQDIVYVLRIISWEGRDTAWTWLKANWDLILRKWGKEMLLTHFVRDIITQLCSNDMADEAEAFFGRDPLPSIALNLKQSLEFVRIKARWIEHIKQEQHVLEELVESLASK